MNRKSIPLCQHHRWVASGVVICLLLHSLHCAPRALMPAAVSLSDATSRPNFGRIAVIVVEQEPDIATGGYARGKCKGAARGAGRAVGGFLGSAAAGSPCAEGLVCGLYFATVLALTPLVAIGGAIAGSVGAVSKRDVRQLDAFLRDTTFESRVSRTIREELISYLPQAYDAVSSHDGRAADTILEIGPLHVRGRGSGANTPVFWEIAAHARLVQAIDGTELQSGRYSYRSCGRTVKDWARDDLALLRGEMQRATESLGEKIADEFILLDAIGARSALAPRSTMSKRKRSRVNDRPETYFGLRPIEPPTFGPAYVRGRNGVPRLKFDKVESARPTLRWERFEPDPERNISNVSYEIRVARSERGLPSDVIDRQVGLLESRHQVAAPLAPATAYFWTVRAHYEIDGKPRVTEWGGIHSQSRNAAKVPGVHSYRFATPRNPP